MFDFFKLSTRKAGTSKREQRHDSFDENLTFHDLSDKQIAALMLLTFVVAFAVGLVCGVLIVRS